MEDTDSLLALQKIRLTAYYSYYTLATKQEAPFIGRLCPAWPFSGTVLINNTHNTLLFAESINL